MLSYKTLSQTYIHEIPSIKGSRFCATLIPIKTQEEGQSMIDTIKKKHYDATHNCHAYRVMPQITKDLFGQHHVTPSREHCSDDGEPANTAGKPMLGQLQAFSLINVLAIVTRYYGGTKLGIGGLIQAYSSTVKAACESAQQAGCLLTKPLLTACTIRYDFGQTGEVMRVCDQYDVDILSQDIVQDERGQKMLLSGRLPRQYQETMRRDLPFDVDLTCNGELII